MDVRLTSADCDEAGDYAVPNVLCPREIVSRPDNMDQTVLHTCTGLRPIYVMFFRFLPISFQMKNNDDMWL